MANPSSQNPTADNTQQATPDRLPGMVLSGAITLAKDSKNYDQATAQFEALLGQLETAKSEPETCEVTIELLRQLWKEYLVVQRAAFFYESISDAEKDLADKMAQSNIQLKQNYMRLIQEQ